ncbi:aspartyl protease family protein [Marchantia polymorpha subsp. ruderalis]|nr:hypothetical protein MARPO_0177s0021 [Marchantia polymorpha]BBN02824.1 hypothetical protein Mp_2g18420 [Marchantia polymorpha subsp. ruderalis]|eukprot:PTQ28010.1 hypothetical protein MARPO_0177s0021 [Marchantia polymorpha]
MATLRSFEVLGMVVLVAAAALGLLAAPASSAASSGGMFVGLKSLDHHTDSPLHKSESTLAERIQNAVKRSNARVAAFKNVVASGITPRGVDFDSTIELTSKSSFESPVSASPGSYIMEISLGTPPQKKTAIVDTGSDLVWLQCAPCSVCYQQPDPVFDPTKSSTYKRIRYFSDTCAELPSRSYSGGFCTYRYGYGDQSTTQGDLALETLTLTTTEGTAQKFENFAFGCGHRNQGTFSGTDGLVGLGRGAISFSEQIGALIGSKFSYCLVPLTSAASETSPLIFGEEAVATGNGLGGLQYTPLVRNPAADTFYYVKMTGIKVGDRAVTGIPASAFALSRSGQGGVILDSGTTLTYLVQSAYTPFLAALRSAVQYPQADGSQIGLDLCFDLAGVDSPSLPPVTLQFQGLDLVLPPNNVFLQVDDAGTVCLAFAGTSDFTIVGNIQQQNHYFLYDLENERVGIAPVDSCANLSSNPAANAAAAGGKDEL